ncbi:PhoX family protein [Mangrovimonas sp. AS39]|uniref:alkaline phosphatase PhoX n=1 Tax=Mangrovimonas futianensis TaxID=2895523 RepID=UPI001E49B072|nr:alkaline phosphatase PhoX [Mangrovimonas futianensis]MCF1191654.1 PhoX family protein [Mangrovimonas futianensis]MCF1195458.1 PhoX family protein [Mangrovimonas futianensis]
MKKVFLLSSLAVCSFFSCEKELTTVELNQTTTNEASLEKKAGMNLENHSITPSFLDLKQEFKNLKVYPILSSEDVLENSPEFVYGSMADGAGLLKNEDGTYTLINNIEADYSIARITLDQNLKPVHGEYILNAAATAATAQCSGSLITPEEHGFGPLYLSGGEWGGASKGVFVTNPFKDANDASVATLLPAMGQWSTENAVAIGKDAYPGKTVVFIGDDHSDNTVPSGQLGMYVGNQGDLDGGNLYGLKVTDPSVLFEMDMEEGQSYPMEFVQLEETQIDLLDAEGKQKGVMGFSRLEDIDWRKGSAENNREIYFCVTGRDKPDLIGKGTKYGRVYKVTLNPEDPTAAGTITCILDGDNLTGKAKAFHSPDNIVVTNNYVYIQEDPNGYYDNPNKDHFASLYEYNINSEKLKTVLECDQTAAQALGYGTTSSKWEITGMIDISDVVAVNKTFILITQNHGWEDPGFTDPNANPTTASNEGSMLYVIQGLKR